ncbi:NAD(P)-dependent oxidoreductase [Bartonella sp. HY038]|uniref:NAD(P)-dependent oxidoreductase n=1 Tax=Bartonella sp. HY038 TaxID=2759660 RepID=UPI0015F95FE5|nr:NAD(P)-dependent oxidoreductase [Bartonella sp. HY038]
MKIAIIAANGRAGQLITKEALDRGHDVTAIIRKGNAADPRAKTFIKDLFDLNYQDLADFDVIIDAFGVFTPDTLDQYQTSLAHLTDILAGHANRLLIVGGAGSLYLDKSHTTRLVDSPNFPEEYKPLALSMATALDALKKRHDINWTFLSPAADFIADGVRTGKYQEGGEEFIVDNNGKSEISYADYAIAMIDEAEKGNHIKKRFSVISQ